MAQAEVGLGHRLEQLKNFLRQDPGNDRLRGEIFDTALSLGAFQDAEDIIVEASRAPGWQNRRGLLALARGEYEKASDLFIEVLELEGEEPFVRYNWAYAQFGLGNLAAAREAASLFLRDAGRLSELAWSLWLRCSHQLNLVEEGLAAFLEAEPNHGMSAESWGVASLMAFDAEKIPEARDWAERALNDEPTQREALVTLGSLALGERDVNKAQHLFEQALSQNDRDGRCWSGIAFTRMLDMDLNQALQAFQRAVTFMPEHIGTWIGMGWCEYLLQHIEAARRAFETALALDRNFSESHGGLAVILAYQGDKEGAKLAAETALRLDGRCLSARFAQSLLTGEIKDREAFLNMTRRALSQHPLPGNPEQSIADIVFRPHR